MQIYSVFNDVSEVKELFDVFCDKASGAYTLSIS